MVEELSLDIFGSAMMRGQCFRRSDHLVQILPPIQPLVEEVEETCRLPPRRRTLRPIIYLQILATLFNLPFEVVRVVEDNIGWPELTFGKQEAGQTFLLDNHAKELERLVQALRDISQNTWTADILHLVQNLKSYDKLLRSLLKDMEDLRIIFRRSATPLQPAPGLHDLARLAQALEVLAIDLARNNNSVLRIPDRDEHIPTLHQLITGLLN